MLVDMLRDGRLHLSGIALLAPHLTATNRDEVLASATHCSKRRIEELVASLAPRPDVPPTIRKLPDRRPISSATPTVSHLACLTSGDGSWVGGSSADGSSRPDETSSAAAAAETAERATPGGKELLNDLETDRANPARGRRTAVVEPLAPERFRIQLTSDLQFHHRHPHGLGGDRSPGNIARFSRGHNAHESRADYGRDAGWPERTTPPRTGPGGSQLRFE